LVAAARPRRPPPSLPEQPRGRKLADAAAAALLARYRIPLVPQRLARSPAAAAAAARELGFPVVLKISSPDIIHKTEAKGVMTHLRSPAEVEKGYQTLVGAARAYRRSARIDGVLVQRQVEGVELIAGSKLDPQFGPVLLVGLGGIFVEVFQDVAFRLVPLAREDARNMLRELKGFPLLQGIRGQQPCNLRALENALLALSHLVEKERPQEMDINPLFAAPQGVWAADVRIIR
ncbi:MAG: acetate--CoA ligase family protein, partial [Candidatus Aenigmarchaeota archaeon]|nr:acetate--CoA ligase family protein [Candidatus Aenigmarchaeota archaeon]